jgi:hypothetical protein
MRKSEIPRISSLCKNLSHFDFEFNEANLNNEVEWFIDFLDEVHSESQIECSIWWIVQYILMWYIAQNSYEEEKAKI